MLATDVLALGPHSFSDFLKMELSKSIEGLDAYDIK